MNDKIIFPLETDIKRVLNLDIKEMPSLSPVMAKLLEICMGGTLVKFVGVGEKHARLMDALAPDILEYLILIGNTRFITRYKRILLTGQMNTDIEVSRHHGGAIEVDVGGFI